MAVMLDINYSKKLGLPNYSSHSLGIGLKAEVANLDEVHREVEKAYSLLQSAVDSQIVHQGFVSNESNQGNGVDQAQNRRSRVNESKTDPDDWKHHWARLGRALCDAVGSGDFTSSEAVLSDLIVLLGEDHDRVAKGREKIGLIRRKVLES